MERIVEENQLLLSKKITKYKKDNIKKRKIFHPFVNVIIKR